MPSIPTEHKPRPHTRWTCPECQYSTWLVDHAYTDSLRTPCSQTPLAGLNLDALEALLSRDTVNALTHRDASKALPFVPADRMVEQVEVTWPFLQRAGIYEPCLLEALTGARTNLHRYPMRTLEWLLSKVDRALLRLASDPFAVQPVYTVYRGVSGVGLHRRVRGIHWTANLELAWWFAHRFMLEKPMVYRLTVTDAEILAYQQREEEFLVLPPVRSRLTRMPYQAAGIAPWQA